jgi:hypothetical protein
VSKIAIHDNGIYKDLITGDILGSNPHKFLNVGDKYIDANNIECVITDKRLDNEGYLTVISQENQTPLVQQQIINLATQEYQTIPDDVKKKMTLWDKVKGWFK